MILFQIKTAFVAIIIISASACALGQNNISFFRNDNKFNQWKPKDGCEIRHFISDDGIPTIAFTDWINGEVSVPISRIDSCVVKQSDIPVIRLSFPDYPNVDCLWEKDLYLSAIMDIEGNGLTEDISQIPLQVKGRGNTTWYMPKKPMRLKFDKKTSVLGLKAAKNYVLLNNYLDPSLMRNAISMWLAQKLGVPYANTIIPCHVFINDHYAGAYTLTEKIGLNSSSVDLDDSKAILFELSTEFDEKYKFRSENLNLPVMVKDPDFDKDFKTDSVSLTPEKMLNLWEEDFNKAEKLVCNGKGAEAFNMESVVNYMLLYEITGNNELDHPKSVYIHKKSIGEREKYFLGPAWDFDYAFNHAYLIDGEYGQVTAFDAPRAVEFFQLLKTTEEYRSLYKQRIEYLEKEIFPQLLIYLDEYASHIEPSAKYNGLRWNAEGIFSNWGVYLHNSYNTRKHTSELKKWLIQRMEYLKSRI